MSNVIPFPREVILEQEIRRCRQMVEKMTDWLENCDLDAPSVDERVRAGLAPQGLADWQDKLNRALAQKADINADDAMRYKGLIYRAYASQAGAN